MRNQRSYLVGSRHQLGLGLLEHERASDFSLQVVLEPINSRCEIHFKIITWSRWLPSLRSSCRRGSCERSEGRQSAVEECSTYL